MTAPSFRTVDQQTGYVTPASAGGLTMAVTVREIDDMRTELQQLREANQWLDNMVNALTNERDVERAELDKTMQSLRDLGSLVADLTSQTAMWHAARDEERERADEWRNRHDVVRDQRDEARTRVQELSTALASAVNDCDTANARAAVL